MGAIGGQCAYKLCPAVIALGDKRTKRFRDILPKNGIHDTLLQHSQSSKYNQKVIDVIFLDINSSVDEL